MRPPAVRCHSATSSGGSGPAQMRLHRGDLLGRHRRLGVEDHALGEEHDAVLAQKAQLVVGKEIVFIVVSLCVELAV